MAKLTGYGIPTDETVGSVGDIYTNLNTAVDYKCVAIHKIATDEVLRYYVWVRVRSDSSGDSGSGGDSGLSNISDMEQLAMLIDTDLLPAVHDASGAILTDENGNIILRY